MCCVCVCVCLCMHVCLLATWVPKVRSEGDALKSKVCGRLTSDVSCVMLQHSMCKSIREELQLPA